MQKLQKENERLRTALRECEEKASRVESARKQETASYDKCLEDAAAHVSPILFTPTFLKSKNLQLAKSIQNHKTLKAENAKMRDQLMKYQWKNTLLMKQLQLLNAVNQQQSITNNNNSALMSKIEEEDCDDDLSRMEFKAPLPVRGPGGSQSKPIVPPRRDNNANPLAMQSMMSVTSNQVFVSMNLPFSHIRPSSGTH